MKETFVRVAEKFEIPWFADLMITASNDINEETILSLNEQVDKIYIVTILVTKNFPHSIFY